LVPAQQRDTRHNAMLATITLVAGALAALSISIRYIKFMGISCAATIVPAVLTVITAVVLFAAQHSDLCELSPSHGGTALLLVSIGQIVDVLQYDMAVVDTPPSGYVVTTAAALSVAVSNQLAHTSCNASFAVWTGVLLFWILPIRMLHSNAQAATPRSKQPVRSAMTEVAIQATAHGFVF